MFITFEGVDGCGKSTQLTLLKDYLIQNGKEAVLTREPGGKGLGENIREILLNYDGVVADRCESFLFLADRAQNIETIVKPAIARGAVVLCDRHTDSSVAYQGYGRQLDVEQIKSLNSLATGGMTPDITFVFDIDTETSMKRVGKDKDRMESAGIEFQKRVRQGYLEIAKQEPNRVKVINSDDTIKNIHKRVVDIYNAVLNKI